MRAVQWLRRGASSRESVERRPATCWVVLGAALLIGNSALTWAADNAAPRVTLAAGVLEGSLDESAPGAVFKGIPYAQPPVGRLRWRAPEPVQPWQGVKRAVSLASPCMQNGAEGPTGDEDCLYLNVWTPQWPVRAAHPVMLYLFGGANLTGSANNPVFDGAELAKRGVVVVTINRRVGVMGFMAHPALSAESPHNSSGNYALLDQIAALRWTRDNIAKFGGDPARVTLFGQSAGSFDLLVLMTSPLAKGLFANAIAQSGQFLSYNGSMPKARAEGLGTRIAADLQAPAGAQTLTYLRELPAQQVVKAAVKWLPARLGSDTGLLTNVDGWVLPELPARVFADGRQMPVALIVGSNSREISPNTSLDELRQQIAATYGDLAPQALAAYGLANGGQGKHDALLGGPGAQWMTDTVQRCAAIMTAQWHAAANHPTWHYQFERSIPGREPQGSFHGAELPYVFGTLDRVDFPGAFPAAQAALFTAADRAASQQIQEYWTRFAKTGNPNGDALPEWPRAGTGRYMAFTAQGSVDKRNLQAEPCRIFREWTLRRLAQQ